MGRCYSFMRRRVVVIQQWLDPYGTKMVRVRTNDDQPEGEEGMDEARFLAEAQPLDLPVELPE